MKVSRKRTAPPAVFMLSAKPASCSSSSSPSTSLGRDAEKEGKVTGEGQEKEKQQDEKEEKGGEKGEEGEERWAEGHTYSGFSLIILYFCIKGTTWKLD